MPLNKQILEMLKLDEQVREDLVKRGELFNGYHPEMEKVHNQNAEKLQAIINEFGWPEDKETSKAAWFIVQHAISKPQFQRDCLKLFKELVELGKMPASQVAYLEDRICMYEGKAQVYGTQFDWDQSGELSPKEILDPSNVEKRRSEVGLPPLDQVIKEIRERSKQEGDRPPEDQDQREQEFIAWAKRVGWRS